MRPGDCAPTVAGTGLAQRLGAADGTVALLFGPAAAGATANALADLLVIRIVPEPTDSAVPPAEAVVDDGRIAHRYGARPGDVVLVRPDGYVGFVGSLTQPDLDAAISRYRSTTGCADAALAAS